MTQSRRARVTRVRLDAAHPEGKLTDTEQLDRVADALALIRGERRASLGTRMDAARWLLNMAFGPAPAGDTVDRQSLQLAHLPLGRR
jgi:hypothetical protein